MSDIVERLRELERVERELAHDSDCPPEATANWQYAETCKSAADEIERLRAALRSISQFKPDEYDMDWADTIAEMNSIARTALKEDGDEK